MSEIENNYDYFQLINKIFEFQYYKISSEIMEGANEHYRMNSILSHSILP